jgi:hypothetical protein
VRLKESEFVKARSEQTFSEHDLNHAKRMYNKECGRKAVVSKVRN